MKRVLLASALALAALTAPALTSAALANFQVVIVFGP